MNRPLFTALMIAIPLAISPLPVGAFAQGNHQVQGHMRKNGTDVQPHQQTNPNSTRMDNYGTKGNVNPYTGQPGTKDPYKR